MLIPLALWPLVLDCSGKKNNALLFERSVVFGSSIVKQYFDLDAVKVVGLCQIGRAHV